MRHRPISASVYGCSGSAHSGCVGARLDHHAEVHHGDHVGDVPHDREVVRDEQQAQREPAREIDEQVRELRLRGRVERRERLVEDEHRRVGGERACDRDPLPLAAAELMREAARPRPREGRRARAARRRARAVRVAARGRARRARRRAASRPSGAGSATSTDSGTPSAGARARAAARAVSSGVTARPSKTTLPAAGRTSPTAARARLDLPQPDSPTRPTIWPRSTVRLAPATARTLLAAAPLVRRPRRHAARARGSSSEGVDVAGEPAPVHRRQRRIVRRADVDGVRAARVVGAARRNLLRRRRRPLDRDQRRVARTLPGAAARRAARACTGGAAAGAPPPAGPASTTRPA